MMEISQFEKVPPTLSFDLSTSNNFFIQAYDYWLDDMYLNNPISLPINSNPGMVFPPRKFSSLSDMAKFAARLVTSALDYKEKIDK